MNSKSNDIFSGGWENTTLGKSFANMSFNMFTMDQLLNDYESNGEDVIRMTLGKSDQPLSGNVKEAMKEALDRPKDILRVDSEGNPLLRREVARYYNNRFDGKLLPENVIIGSQGTSSLYRDIFMMLLQSGGRVLLPKPGYILYDAAAKLMQSLRGDVFIDHYNIDVKSGRIDLNSFNHAFDKEQTCIVVVNSPGNPMGNLVSYDEWNEIINVVNSGNRAVIISDQVYSNMVFGGKSYPSILDKMLNGRIKRPYIISDSMSKGFEMYTFRVGYAIVPDDLVKPLTTFQRNFSLTPNTIAQFGAIKALGQTESVKNLCDIYETRYNKALAELADVRGIEVCPVGGGFYMLVCCQELIKQSKLENDFSLAMNIAKNTMPHIGVTPGSDFGAPGCLRISFSPESFNEGICSLANYLDNI